MKNKPEVNWYWIISHTIFIILAIISLFFTPKEYDIPIAMIIVGYQVVYFTLVIPLIDEK